jgi:hypothetical protein
MADQQVELLLQHLKATVIKFEAGYAAMTEARAELHKVTQNFKLESIPLPEAYAKPDSAEEVTFEVALWPSTAGGTLKASGSIDGTNYRVLLFEGKKEGVLLSGSIVPSDAPEGSEIKDISMGYAAVKPRKDGQGNELSLKFEQLDDWFNGNLERVVSDNPKAPAFKAAMRKGRGKKAVANNPLLNVLQQLDVPLPAAPAPVPEPVHVPVAPVVPAGPDLSDFFNKPVTPKADDDIPLFTPEEQQAKANPLADMFGGAAKLPEAQVPSWLLS